MGHGIAVADFDLGAVFAARAEEGADDSFLVYGAAGCVVEDGEDSLRRVNTVPYITYFL